jgi:hypothetical protein
MKVLSAIDTIELENDTGRLIESVSATCSRCGHATESFGTSDSSIRRCLVLLREECPEGEDNFYVDEGADEGEA